MPFNTSAKYANGGRNSWLKKILCAVNFPNRSKHSGDQPQPRHPRVESAANSHEAYGNTQGPGAGVGGESCIHGHSTLGTEKCVQVFKNMVNLEEVNDDLKTLVATLGEH